METKTFICPACLFALPMLPTEFPLHCRCGAVYYDPAAGAGAEEAAAYARRKRDRLKTLAGDVGLHDCDRAQVMRELEALNYLLRILGDRTIVAA